MSGNARERNQRRTGSSRKKSSIIGDEIWKDAKPKVRELYLRQNQNAEHVTQWLQDEYGIFVTTRQLKTQLKNWEFDQKRIAGPAYRAMLYVMEELREDVDFEAILRSGLALKVKPASDIRKEVKRQTATRKPVSTPWNSVRDALDYLRIHCKIAPTRAYLPSIVSYLTAHQLPSHDLTVNFTTLDNDPGDAQSTTSEESQSDLFDSTSPPFTYPDGSYQQRHPTVNPVEPGLDTSLPPRLWNQIPNPNTFTLNLHANVLPHTAENQINNSVQHSSFPQFRSITEPRILHMDDPFGDLTLSLADMTLQFDHNDPRKTSWEKFLGIQLEQHYRHPSREGNRLIVEFVAYYIQQTLAGFDTLDDYDHVDRKEARAKLRKMLDAGNQQTLTSINWISAVIGSHDKGAQLSAFYEDCYACIEGNDSYAARVVKPAIEFALSTLGQTQRTPENLSASPNSRAKRHKALAENFDGEREFSQSIYLLEQHGHQDSPMHLTLRYHYAWYLLQKGDAEKALRILLSCTNSAERLMGCNHLVTINCYALAARAYLQLGDTELARNDLQMAISRLYECPNPLRAYRHRLRERLARMDMDKGDYESALQIMENVFQFRLDSLGPSSAPTWEALGTIREILERFGQKAEAVRREAELQTRYEEEWRQTRMAVD